MGSSGLESTRSRNLGGCRTHGQADSGKSRNYSWNPHGGSQEKWLPSLPAKRGIDRRGHGQRSREHATELNSVALSSSSQNRNILLHAASDGSRTNFVIRCKQTT